MPVADLNRFWQLAQTQSPSTSLLYVEPPKSVHASEDPRQIERHPNRFVTYRFSVGFVCAFLDGV